MAANRLLAEADCCPVSEVHATSWAAHLSRTSESHGLPVPRSIWRSWTRFAARVAGNSNRRH